MTLAASADAAVAAGIAEVEIINLDASGIEQVVKLAAIWAGFALQRLPRQELYLLLHEGQHVMPLSRI